MNSTTSIVESHIFLSSLVLIIGISILIVALPLLKQSKWNLSKGEFLFLLGVGLGLVLIGGGNLIFDFQTEGRFLDTIQFKLFDTNIIDKLSRDVQYYSWYISTVSCLLILALFAIYLTQTSDLRQYLIIIIYVVCLFLTFEIFNQLYNKLYVLNLHKTKFEFYIDDRQITGFYFLLVRVALGISVIGLLIKSIWWYCKKSNI